MEGIKLLSGDCLEIMKSIADKSIDMVLTDPPYGTTRNRWDSVIEFEPMWKELKRITKDNSAICLFSQQPFSSTAVMSNLKMFRYEWIWEKHRATGHLNARKFPLKSHENILIFSKKRHKYNPQMSKGKPYRSITGSGSSNYGKTRPILIDNKGTRYPRTTLRFKNVNTVKQLHPTQKPVELLEYLVKTYTDEGDTVLDFTMGSGSTGVACKNTGRKFIGIEKDLKYFEISKERLEAMNSYEEIYKNG